MEMVETTLSFTCDSCNMELDVSRGEWTVECPNCFSRVVVPRHFRAEEPVATPFRDLTSDSLPVSGSRASREPVTRCGNHPSASAGWRCDRCNDLLCRDCVVNREVRGMALEVCACGGCCVPLTDEEMGTRPPDVQQMAGAFSFPLQGHGPALILVGTLFVWVTSIMASYSLFFGLALLIFLWGYLTSYMIRVISTTAIGNNEPPEWQGIEDMWEGILKPFLMVSLAGIVCFIPGLTLLALGGLPLWLVIGVLALGGFFFPMALTTVAMFETLMALNPVLIVQSILRVPGSYTIACIFFFIAVFFRVVSEVTTMFIPLLNTFIGTAVSIYFLMVQARILGLLFRLNQRKLEWF